MLHKNQLTIKGETGLELEYRLKALGYSIAGSVSCGEEAIQLVGELKPDLVMK